jgi:hypothetical protein
VDAPLTLEGLISELNDLLDLEDFEGAEALLLMSMAAHAEREFFLHYQLGKVYSRWNKMSSAIAHYTKSAELAHERADEVFLIQIREDLKTAKRRQAEQKP